MTTSPIEILKLAKHVADGNSVSNDRLDSAKSLSARLFELDPSLLLDSLNDILVSEHISNALQWLQSVGAIAVLLPELEATVSFTQEADRRHKDVWEHIKKVAEQTPNTAALRWCALLHDVGKVPTRKYEDNGKVTFHGHAEVGARMFRKVSKRLAFPKPLADHVHFLILHHQRVSQYASSWSDSAVRRFRREMQPYLNDVIRFARSDITTAFEEKYRRVQAQVDELVSRMDTIHALDTKAPPLPKGIGSTIINKLGVPPGPRVGELKDFLEAAIESGELMPQQDEHVYIDYLKAHQGS